jgi:hypothetical protein
MLKSDVWRIPNNEIGSQRIRLSQQEIALIDPIGRQKSRLLRRTTMLDKDVLH